MKCTNCGYETQPGAKFCVQCGTTMVSPTGTQAAPPPPAATPAPSPSATSVGAAPRPTAAAPSAASLSATMARAAAAAPPVAARPPLGPGPSAVSLPTADIAPGRKTGLMIALIAVGAAVLVGGFFGYRMLFPDAADSTATQSSPPAMKASPADAKDVSTASPAGPAAVDSSSVQQATAPPPDEVKSTASAPSTDKSSPAAAATATGKTDSASVKADMGKAAASSATPPASTAAGPGVTGSPPAKTAAAVTSGSQDRWQQMAEAMARCQREDFFSRVGCQQRVGRRFCEGYWGSVPQCPGGAPKDKAQ